MSTHSIQPYSLTVNFFLFIICFSSCKNHSAAELPAAISKGAPAKGDNFLVFKKVSGAADSPINRFQPSFPIVNVLKNDYPLAGKYRLQGMISTKGPGEIQLDSTGIHIVLQVNTHEGMKLMNVDHVQGSLEAEDIKEPGGIRSFSRLLTGNKILLGYIWQTAQVPLSFTGPGEFLLKQDSLRQQPRQPGTFPLDVQVNTDKGKVKITPGTVTSFIKAGTSYQVYIQTSLFQLIPAGTDGHTGYVLHGMICRTQ